MINSAAEDTHFQMKKSVNCLGRLLDLSTPVVMGILNLTPDSFFDGGKYPDEKSILDKAGFMLSSGASIIDIGGQSTRPGSTLLSPEEEWERLDSVLPKLVNTFPSAIFSIDTFHSVVAAKAIDNGVAMVNDVSGGMQDPLMFELIARLNVPYILMHMQGTPRTMQENPVYINVVQEVMDYFIVKIERLRSAGVHDIIIDPGFGFGKTNTHNFQLLENLELFRMLDCPLMAGLSRKSMITKVLGVKPEQALNGTTVLNTIALLKGARILRVHDVQEAVEAIRLVKQTRLV